MEIDVQIERINNGYIVTGNDSTQSRTYYPSLEKFAEARIVEQLREHDRTIREHEMPEKPFTFRLTCGSKSQRTATNWSGGSRLGRKCWRTKSGLESWQRATWNWRHLRTPPIARSKQMASSMSLQECQRLRTNVGFVR